MIDESPAVTVGPCALMWIAFLPSSRPAVLGAAPQPRNEKRPCKGPLGDASGHVAGAYWRNVNCQLAVRNPRTPRIHGGIFSGGGRKNSPWHCGQ
jgi:hypothetical protein